jgi:hypothetical protein
MNLTTICSQLQNDPDALAWIEKVSLAARIGDRLGRGEKMPAPVVVARVVEGGDAVFLGPVGLEVAEGLAVEAADEADHMRVGGKAKFVQLVGLGPAANATAISTWGPAPMQTLGMSIATGAKTVKAASAAVVLVDAPTMSPELQANIACKVCASGCKRKGIVAGPFFGLVTATLVFNW